MLFVISINFCFTSCSTANLSTSIADRIARAFKTSGTTQTVVFEAESGMLVLLASLGCMAL